MKPNTVIAPTIAAVSETRIVSMPSTEPLTIVAVGLAGAETAPLHVSVDDGVTWQPLMMNGAAVELTATNTVYVMPGHFTVAVSKGGTVGAAGVYAFTSEKN